MSCDRFKSRLLDFALGADDAEFRAHLDGCASCPAQLETQQALLASIDRGVASIVQGEPPGDFAAHVRRRIAEKSAAPRPWFAGWRLITAAAALGVVAIVALLMIGRPPRPPQSARVQLGSPIAPAVKPREATSPSELARGEAPRSGAVGQRTMRPPRQPQLAANREPEVLVPRGEMAAVMRLYEANWNGKADGASLVAQLPPVEESLKPMAFEELRIPALQLVPLNDGEKPKAP
jgi:anti-sigma factor RsiW